MTLHETVDTSKKAAVGTGIGIGVIVIFVVLFRVGVAVKDIMFPPKIEPPSHTFGTIPPLQFPPNAATGDFTYSIQTVSGSLPTDFPDRVNVYQINQPQPSLSNLDVVKKKLQQLGITSTAGTLPQEIQLDSGNYEWDENNPIGFNRKVIFDTVSFNFKITSNYISQRSAKVNNTALTDKGDSIEIIKGVLQNMQSTPDDIDLTKTQTPDQNLHFITSPQYYAIRNSSLIPVQSFADADVLRVDLYQKDLTYKLNTGVSNNDHVLQTRDMDIPIIYPHPPYSTMNFLVAVADGNPQVVQANFAHQDINIPTDGSETTYAIKTPEEAYEELKNGKGYIAAYSGTDKQIQIQNVYLAYYLGETLQPYLMPVIVFEGQNGFFAYISAVRNEWIK